MAKLAVRSLAWSIARSGTAQACVDLPLQFQDQLVNTIQGRHQDVVW